jgi:arsenate reductase
MNKKILILCTGNSCRSQMAEAFLKSCDPELEVVSAGTEPAAEVNPHAVTVMAERGIDLSDARPEHVNTYLDHSFDAVVTVCDHAKETCPVFPGKIGQRVHLGFDDPADAQGSEEEILAVFRRVRDEIDQAFKRFYDDLVSS